MMGETYVIGFYRMFGENTVKDIVEDAMVRHELSTRTLADRACVGETTIRKWLTTDSTIKYETLERIFAALDALDKE